MVTCVLMGGLGNQLFQVAATIGVAEKFKCGYAIPQTWNNAWMFAGDFNLSTVHLPRYHELNFHYDEINDYNIELYGYFQSQKYFKHCEKKIRKMFSPSKHVEIEITRKYKSLLKKYNTCGIHVRRGDYLMLPEYHYNLDVDYYITIMNMFPGLHYVCFSDDIDWCKSNIPAHTFIDDCTAIEFHLMSMMRHNIIANSTFSWWASWLNGNKDKMIFAPPKNKWFGEKKAHLNVDDLYCDNWIYEK